MSSASAVATHRRVAQLVAALVAFTIAWSPLLSAHATFSIVAADRATGQVGGAGSSCVGRNTISQIYGSAPGHGVVHAQALFSGDPSACDLAERLMRALEAGGTGDIGDSRCTDRGIPSDGAFIQVDPSGQAPATYLLLQIDDTAPDDPLVLLRAMFDDWRTENPCVVAPPPPPPMLDAGVERDAGVDAADAIDGAIDDGDATSSPPPDAAPPIRARDSGCAAVRSGAENARITGWLALALASAWIAVSRRRRALGSRSNESIAPAIRELAHPVRLPVWSIVCPPTPSLRIVAVG